LAGRGVNGTCGLRFGVLGLSAAGLPVAGFAGGLRAGGDRLLGTGAAASDTGPLLDGGGEAGIGGVASSVAEGVLACGVAGCSGLAPDARPAAGVAGLPCTGLPCLGLPRRTGLPRRGLRWETTFALPSGVWPPATSVGGDGQGRRGGGRAGGRFGERWSASAVATAAVLLPAPLFGSGLGGVASSAGDCSGVPGTRAAVGESVSSAARASSCPSSPPPPPPCASSSTATSISSPAATPAGTVTLYSRPVDSSVTSSSSPGPTPSGTVTTSSRSAAAPSAAAPSIA